MGWFTNAANAIGRAMDRATGWGPDPDAEHRQFMMDRGYTAAGVAMADPESRYLQRAWDLFHEGGDPRTPAEADLFEKWTAERPDPEVAAAMESVMDQRHPDPEVLTTEPTDWYLTQEGEREAEYADVQDRKADVRGDAEKTAQVEEDAGEWYEPSQEERERALEVRWDDPLPGEPGYVESPAEREWFEGQQSPTSAELDRENEEARQAHEGESNPAPYVMPDRSSPQYIDHIRTQNYLSDVEQSGKEWADEQHAGTGIPEKEDEEARQRIERDANGPEPEGYGESAPDPEYSATPARDAYTEMAEANAINPGEYSREALNEAGRAADTEWRADRIARHERDMEAEAEETVSDYFPAHDDHEMPDERDMPPYGSEVPATAYLQADPGIRESENNVELQRWGTDPKAPESAVNPPTGYGEPIPYQPWAEYGSLPGPAKSAGREGSS